MEEKMFTRSEPTDDGSADHHVKISFNQSASAASPSQQSAKAMDFARPEPHKSTASQPSRPSEKSTQPTARPSAKQAQPASRLSAPSGKPAQSVPKPITRSHKSKAKSSPKANHKIIFFACGALAILAVVLITWGIMSVLNRGVSEDTTFTTNDTQATISLDAGTNEDGSERHTRVVYQFDGDGVVGQKTYFEYPSQEAAQAALETLKDQPEFKGGEVIDNYIVVVADASKFKGLTADDIRQQAEAIERFQQSQKKSEAPADETPADEAPAEAGPEESAEK